MKKLILLAVFLFLGISLANAQQKRFLLDDALQLANIAENEPATFNNLQNTVIILEHYLDIPSAAFINYQDCYTRLGKCKEKIPPANKFLDEIVKKLDGKFKPETKKEQDTTIVFTSSLSKLDDGAGVKGLFSTIGGSTAFNTVADGLAKFLAKRFKQELAANVFDNLTKYITDTSKPEVADLEYLLPNTFGYIRSMSNTTSGLGQIPQVLKENVIADYNNMLPNIQSYINNGKTIKSIKDDNLKFAIKCIPLVIDISKAKHPSEIIDKLDKNLPLDVYKSGDDGSLPKPVQNVKSAVNTLKFISDIMRTNNETSRKWIDLDKLSTLLSNTNFQDAFFGLSIEYGINFYNDAVAEKDKNGSLILIKKYENSKVLAFVKKLEVAFNNQQTKDKVINIINSISKLVNDIDNVADEIVKKKATGAKVEDYINLSLSVINFIDKGGRDIACLILDENDCKATGNIITNIKKYSEMGIKLYGYAKNKNYVMIGSSILQIIEEAKKGDSGTVDNKFLPYIMFLSQIAEAEDSDDMEKAIEAVALPPGSSSIKRKTQWNISLNSYVGGSAAWQRITYDVSTTEEKPSTKFTPAFTALVGLSVNKGLRTCGGKQAGSLTLHLNVLDIGALTAFRLNDDTTKVLPKFSLENIVAPGAHLIYGIPNCPIAVSVFGQYGPSLRNIDNTNATISKTGWRYGLSLTFDIPLLNLWTRPVPVRQ